MKKVFKYFSICSLVALCLSDVYGQNLYLKRADNYMEHFDFQSAIEIYSLVIKKHPDQREAIEGLAKAYRLTNDMYRAELWYEKACLLDSMNASHRFYLAQCLQSNMKYEEAADEFKKYYSLTGSKAPAAIMLSEDQLNGKSVADNLFEIGIIPINTSSNDFSPVFYQGGIVFASNRPSKKLDRTDVWTGLSFMNIYYASQEEDIWMEGELLKGKVPNNLYHDGPVAFSADEQEMYLTRSNYTKRKAGVDDEQTVLIKIFRLKYSGKSEKWGDIEELSINSESYSVGHASLSPDSEYLYFMSDMPGGYGETDIYRCKREGDSWSEPKNLGPSINTAGKEMFPFIDRKGNLYFSSNGHLGLGGLDVYMATNNNKGFDRAVHLGVPLNSNADDFGLIMSDNGVDGFISSNREGGEGKDDIFSIKRNGILLSGVVSDFHSGESISESKLAMFRIPTDSIERSTYSMNDGSFLFVAIPNEKLKLEIFKPGYFIKTIDFQTFDESLSQNVMLKKREAIELDLTVKDKIKGEPIPFAVVELVNVSDGSSEVFKTDEFGSLKVKMLPDKDYEVLVSKDIGEDRVKYLSVREKISTLDYFFEVINEEIELELVKLEVPIVLNNILYDFNKSDIRSDAEEELSRLLKIMNDNPMIEIELSSHADSRGDDKYNLDLTAKRASSVVHWLNEHGIQTERMKAAGYGELKLLNHCSNGVECSEEEHQENRRTEFTILKF